MGVTKIPTSVAEVTPAWLSAALTTADARVEVAAAEPERIVHGAGTKLLVRLDYTTDERGLPQRLWVKAGWEEHSPAMAAAGIYAREATFYATLAPAVGSRAPGCFHTAQDGTGRSVVILEDLADRDADLWDCTVARSIDDASDLLETLARLHARWWEDDAVLDMPGIDVPVDPQGPTAVWPRANGGERLREIVAGARGSLMPPALRDAQRIEAAFWKMVDTLGDKRGRCLLHGDAHPGNCFSDSAGAGLFDWQTIARGPWAYDVSYMLVTTLSPEDRRSSERELLKSYFKVLKDAGVTRLPSWEEGWRAYRMYIAYPLLIWPTNHVSHQSEDNIRALTERLSIAADDFGFFDLWKV